MASSWVLPPVGLLPLPLPLNGQVAGTYMPNASWRRAGVARRNGEGYLPPGGREKRVIFGENYAGHPLRRAWGRAPSVFACSWRWGVAGRVDLPAGMGSARRQSRLERGKVLLPHFRDKK